MNHHITLIPGDMPGAMIARSVQNILDAADVAICWDVQECGEGSLSSEGALVPDRVLDSIRQHRTALKNPLGTPPGSATRNPTAYLRKSLDLFCNIRPVRHLWPIPAKYPQLDIIIVREALEDVYAGIEHEVVPGVVETLKVTTAGECERISRAAFEYAVVQQRRRVTTVHKANIMKVSDGLFLETSRRIAGDFPQIEHKDMIVDNCAMQLVAKPSQFDVLLIGNLFGDIISDLCAGLIGGSGLVPSINVSHEGIHIFESTSGVNKHLTDPDQADPLPLISAATYMLRALHEEIAAERIVAAVTLALKSGIRAGSGLERVPCSIFTEAVVQRLKHPGEFAA